MLATAEKHAGAVEAQDAAERKRAAEILEQTVAERTAELRESVAELEAFSYTVSHDLRSSLRIMQSYAQTLLDEYGGKLDPEGVASLQKIQRAANRLNILIRDLLRYGRIAKGEIELKPVPLDSLVEDLIQNRPEFQSVKSCFRVSPPLPTVLGHEAYLTQCLANLMANALKFVATGKVPEVRIHGELEGGRARVCVSDNGIGIHPDDHARIFEAFGRVYPESRYPGTGLGLAIVKKAVARMGGETGFQSELEHGSQFWFTLPIAE